MSGGGPMTLLRFLWYAKWFAPVAFQLLIVGAMIYRKLVREFPVFVAYATFDVLYSIVRFAITTWLPDSYYALYFYFSWTGKFVELVLAFAVIREIFVHVFRSYDALRALGTLLFRWALAILILLAVISTASGSAADPSHLISQVTLVERGLSVIQCGLLLLLFLFSSYFGLSWRDYLFGIALGFGFYATLELASIAMRVEIGPSFDNAFNVILPVAYNCSVLIWITYLLRSESARGTVMLRPSPELTEWNHELARLLHQ